MSWSWAGEEDTWELEQEDELKMKEPLLICPTLQHAAEHGVVLLSIKQDVVGHDGNCHG